jgi:hypothetical protein
MEEKYIYERIKALEAELGLIKRRITMPRLTEEQIESRIQEYRSLVREISSSLKVKEDPDSYIAKLRAKEY